MNIEIIFKYILPIGALVLSFYLGVFKERCLSKTNHDRKIFAKIEKILNDEMFYDYFKKPGYLPADAFAKCDELDVFIINPANQFLNKELNKIFRNFQKSFFELNNYYSLSPYGDYINNGKTFKLIAIKKGDQNEDNILREAEKRKKNSEDSYRHFRSLIKQKLHM